MRAAVLDTVTALTAADARAREAASLPFLRLLALACADGLFRRAARAGGRVAARYAALAEFHAMEADETAGHLVAQCRRGSLDAAYDAVFLG